MALVGDVLVSVREQIPDPAQALDPVGFFTAIPSLTDGNLGSATYYITLTGLNQWGESIGSDEQAIPVVGPTGSILVTPVLGLGATGYRVYVSTQSGNPRGFYTITGSGPFVITGVPGGNFFADQTPGQLPTRATGTLPDSDGDFVSAATLYRYLRGALERAGRMSGGITDFTGVHSVSGRGYYSINLFGVQWINFTNAWFDGWDLFFGKKSDLYRHSAVTSVPGTIVVEKFENDLIIQLWPQANRTGAQNYMGQDIASDDTTMIVQNSVNFLSLGICQVGSEIIGYSGVSGNQLNGLIRGMGGTAPVAHLLDDPVNELNIQVSGKRMPVMYSVGDSALTLRVPPGWENLLPVYILAHVKRAEQDMQAFSSLMKEFDEGIKGVSAMTTQSNKPKQVGPRGRDVYPSSPFGGIFIP